MSKGSKSLGLIEIAGKRSSNEGKGNGMSGKIGPELGSVIGGVCSIPEDCAWETFLSEGAEGNVQVFVIDVGVGVVNCI